jgi:hypothetical protein
MSTATTEAVKSKYPWAHEEAQEKPKVVVTGLIRSIGKPQTTNNGEGYYDKCLLTIESTRGSRRFGSPSIMFRPEMFSVGSFDPEVHYTRNPAINVASTNSKGQPTTLDKSFRAVYNLNVVPRITEWNNKKKGTSGVKVSSVTPLMAIAGGTVEDLNVFCVNIIGSALSQIEDRKAGDFGFPELTSDEIHELLSSWLTNAPSVEQLFIVKQQRDFKSGELTDNYELASFEGPLTQENHERMVRRANESQSKPNAGDRLTIGYSV